MNRCAYEQKAFVVRDVRRMESLVYPYEQKSFVACEDMKMEPLVCPKPRRLGNLNPPVNDQIRPLRFHSSHQMEMSDSKAGMDLLDIILTKDSYGTEKSGMQITSSPPFFCGSPPSRASNPVVQDIQFGNLKITPLPPSPLSPSSSAARKGGGCARVNFGLKPAPVRVEGFDCLSRDGRNCSISAVA